MKRFITSKPERSASPGLKRFQSEALPSVERVRASFLGRSSNEALLAVAFLFRNSPPAKRFLPSKPGRSASPPLPERGALPAGKARANEALRCYGFRAKRFASSKRKRGALQFLAGPNEALPSDAKNPAGAGGLERGLAEALSYSTVTDLARLRGWSAAGEQPSNQVSRST